MNSFANTLIYLRKRDGLSQQDLADKIDISRSQIGMYETGQRMPSREVLEAIADTFNVSVDFLIGRVDTGKYSGVFRSTLGHIIDTRPKADLEAAGVDLYNAGLIVDGTIPLTFDRACELADQLGEGLDTMMGMENPATSKDDGATEITEIFTALSPENRAKLLELSRLYLSGQHNSVEKQ